MHGVLRDVGDSLVYWNWNLSSATQYSTHDPLETIRRSSAIIHRRAIHMDFEIPDKVKPLVTKLRAFVREEIFPLEAAFLNGEFSDLLPVLAETRARVKAAGLWAPHMPQAY